MYSKSVKAHQEHAKKFQKSFPEYVNEEIVDCYSCKRSGTGKTFKHKGKLFLSYTTLFYYEEGGLRSKGEKIVIPLASVTGVSKKKVEGVVLDHTGIEINTKPATYIFTSFHDVTETLSAIVKLWNSVCVLATPLPEEKSKEKEPKTLLPSAVVQTIMKPVKIKKKSKTKKKTKTGTEDDVSEVSEVSEDLSESSEQNEVDTETLEDTDDSEVPSRKRKLLSKANSITDAAMKEFMKPKKRKKKEKKSEEAVTEPIEVSESSVAPNIHIASENESENATAPSEEGTEGPGIAQALGRSKKRLSSIMSKSPVSDSVVRNIITPVKNHRRKSKEKEEIRSHASSESEKNHADPQPPAKEESERIEPKEKAKILRKTSSVSDSVIRTILSPMKSSKLKSKEEQEEAPIPETSSPEKKPSSSPSLRSNRGNHSLLTTAHSELTLPAATPASEFISNREQTKKTPLGAIPTITVHRTSSENVLNETEKIQCSKADMLKNLRSTAVDIPTNNRKALTSSDTVLFLDGDSPVKNKTLQTLRRPKRKLASSTSNLDQPKRFLSLRGNRTKSDKKEKDSESGSKIKEKSDAVGSVIRSIRDKAAEGIHRGSYDDLHQRRRMGGSNTFSAFSIGTDGSRTERLKSKIKKVTENSAIEDIRTQRNLMLNQFKRPIESLKENVKGMSNDSSVSPIHCPKTGQMPTGQLVHCYITILEAQGLGSSGGYVSMTMSDAHSNMPFLSAKTAKVKGENPKWNGKIETFLFDDRSFLLKFVCKSTVELSLGSGSLLITNPVDFFAYEDWIQMTDKAGDVKSILRLRIQCSAVMSEDSLRVSNNFVESRSSESVSGSEGLLPTTEYDITSSPKISHAVNTSLRCSENIPREDLLSMRKGRFKLTGSDDTALETVKKPNRARLKSMLNKNKAVPEESKFRPQKEEPHFYQSVISPELTLQVGSTSIPFVIKSPVVSLNSLSLHPREEIHLNENLNNSLEGKDVKSQKTVDSGKIFFSLPEDKKDIVSIPFPILQRPCFVFPHLQIMQSVTIRLNEGTGLECETRDHIGLAALQAKIIGDPQTKFSGTFDRPIDVTNALQFALETPDEIKARLFEERLLKQSLLNEINDMHCSVRNASCTMLGLGDRNNNKQLLTKTTSQDDWLEWRDDFHRKISHVETTVAADVAGLREQEDPVQETWDYCKHKFTGAVLPERPTKTFSSGRIQRRNSKGVFVAKQRVKSEPREESTNSTLAHSGTRLRASSSLSQGENPRSKLSESRGSRLRKKTEIDVHSHPTTAKEIPKFSASHYTAGGIIILLIILYYFFM